MTIVRESLYTPLVPLSKLSEIELVLGEAISALMGAGALLLAASVWLPNTSLTEVCRFTAPCSFV